MSAPVGGAPGGAPAKTTGGCRKGCLVGCGGLLALVAVLAVGGWLGWRRWGRPWLAKKEQAVAHYVPSGLLHGHGDTAGSGGAAPSHLAAALAPKLPASPGKTGRGDLPHDLWVPAATGPAAYDTQAGGLATAVVRVTGGSVTRLTRAARRGMHAQGWKLLYAGADGKGQVLRFTRRRATARVGLYPRAGAVEVWVSRRATSAGSRSGSGAGSAE